MEKCLDAGLDIGDRCLRRQPVYFTSFLLWSETHRDYRKSSSVASSSWMLTCPWRGPAGDATEMM